MGTRADFYIATQDGAGLDWRGSIAWDGYPEGIDDAVLQARTGADFAAALAGFFADRDDVTLPDMGWPWSWNDSNTTDFGYVLIEGRGVYYSPFGREVYAASSTGGVPVSDIAFRYPDMSDRKAATLGPRSGMIVFGASTPA